MPEVAVHTTKGGVGQTMTLRDDVFGQTPNTALLHQAVVRQLANARQGTHDTQTRGEVNRTTRKAWRQKGTGRARQGSRKAPHWRGGGVVFGPHPRDHRQAMPRKMRAAAVRAALAAKVAAGEIVVVDEITMEQPSTKQLAAFLLPLSGGESTLVMLDAPQTAVRLSARNLPRVTMSTIDNVNVVDLLRHRRLVLNVAAVRLLEERLGGAVAADAAPHDALASDDAPPEVEPAPAAGRSPRTRAAKAAAEAEPEAESGEATGAEPVASEESAAPAETAPKPRRRRTAKAAGDAEGEE